MNHPIPASKGMRGLFLGRIVGGVAAVATVFSLTVMIPIQGAYAAGADPISVPDANFEQCLLDALPPGHVGDITEDDAASITAPLNCNAMGISNIAGAEYLTGLTSLQFFDNEVTSITPLQYLTDLESLSLSYNTIVDIAPLQNLLNLESLWLNENKIAVIDALSSMGEIEILDLSHNKISDLNPLSGMHKLRLLFLDENSITDVSPLNGNLPIIQANGLKLGDQIIDLGELEIGTPTARPTVTDENGDPIALNLDSRDNGDGTFTPSGTPGVADPLVWSQYVAPGGIGNSRFSGEFIFTQAVAPADPVIGLIEPGAEFTTCDAPRGASGTGEPGAHLYVALWGYPGGYSNPPEFIEQVETDVDADGMWSVDFTSELGDLSYSVAADQRVAGDPAGYTEVEFTVTEANCATGSSGDASGSDVADGAQDRATLANTGGNPIGGVLGAGGLLLTAGAAIFLGRRRWLTAP